MKVGRIRFIIGAALALDSGGNKLALAAQSCGIFVGYAVRQDDYFFVD